MFIIFNKGYIIQWKYNKYIEFVHTSKSLIESLGNFTLDFVKFINTILPVILVN